MADPEARPPEPPPRTVQELAERHWKRLFGLAYMMVHDTPLAEDITQEVLRKTMERLHTFHGDTDLYSWAATIAINLCRDSRRGEKYAASAIPQDDLHAPRNPGPGPATTAVQQETYHRVAAAVAGLDPEWREAFVLHYVEGLPFTVVAQICGTSEGNARMRAVRGREALSRQLESLLDPDIRRRMEEDRDPRARNAAKSVDPPARPR